MLKHCSQIKTFMDPNNILQLIIKYLLVWISVVDFMFEKRTIFIAVHWKSEWIPSRK